MIVRGESATRDNSAKKADYLLFYKPNLPIAVVEAKDNNHAVGDGMQQALDYAETLDVSFAYSSNGDAFLEHDRTVTNQMVVIPISRPAIHQRWAELYSHAKAHGLAIQHDHNDVWIAATAHVAGLRLLSSDRAAFLPLRGSPWLVVVVLDPKTGRLLA